MINMADINDQHAEHFWEGTSEMYQHGNTTFPLFITCQIWRQVQIWLSTQKLDTLHTGPDIRQIHPWDSSYLPFNEVNHLIICQLCFHCQLSLRASAALGRNCRQFDRAGTHGGASQPMNRALLKGGGGPVPIQNLSNEWGSTWCNI